MFDELCLGVSCTAVVNCGREVNESNIYIYIYLIYMHTYSICVYTYYLLHMHACVLYVCVHITIMCITKASLNRNTQTRSCVTGW